MKIYRENDVFTPWSAGFISFSLFLLIITIPLGIIYGIIRNLIERTENNRLGDGFAPLIITKNEFNIHDKDGIHIIPMKDIISVSGWRKLETSLSGVRQATTTYPFGVLKIKTTNKTFKIKKISYISEVVFFLNHIISNPIKLEMLTNINPEVVTSEMYGVFASKFSFGRTYYFGKKAKEEDKEFESDFIKKIDAILSFSK